jgi:hypothetical protein
MDNKIIKNNFFNLCNIVQVNKPKLKNYCWNEQKFNEIKFGLQ